LEIFIVSFTKILIDKINLIINEILLWRRENVLW
jgi:hypothetical protein